MSRSALRHPTDTTRKADLVLIHQGQSQLGLAEQPYRLFLQAAVGVTSSADMTPSQRKAVIQKMRECGAILHRTAPKQVAKPGMKQFVPVDQLDRQIWSIEQLLLELKLPLDYANAMAKRMYKVDSITWLKPAQKRGLISALTKFAARKTGVKPEFKKRRGAK